MELIDLLEHLHLDRVNDSTLQKAARGLAYELIIDPLEDEFRSGHILDAARKEQMRTILNASMISGLKKAVEGSLFDKLKAAMTVKRKADRKNSLPDAVPADIDIALLLKAAEAMHIHHMSEQDYLTLAGHISSIMLDHGRTAELFEWNTPVTPDVFTAVQTDAVNKIYTGLKTALGHQDFLIQRAEESKERAQNH